MNSNESKRPMPLFDFFYVFLNFMYLKKIIKLKHFPKAEFSNFMDYFLLEI